MNKWWGSLTGQRPLWVTMLLTLLAVFALGCANFAEQLVNELETVVQESESVQQEEQTAPSDTTSTGTNQIEAEQESESDNGSTSTQAESASDSPRGFVEVSDYIREHGTLPDNYLTKKEAQALGWVAAEGNLHEVAPGMSIGGDRFGNREKMLPDAKGRVWYEADINYEGGRRNAYRIVFSNDGLIYMTTDHYQSFTDITEKGSVPK